MFLTKEEIQALTNKKRLSSQIAILKSLGIVYKLRPDGSPVVLKAHVEQLLGVKVAAVEQKPERTWEPDWDAFRAREQARVDERKARQEASRERKNAERKKRGLDPIP